VILARLFLIFAKIGLVGFGGGYAMIPLIGEEIEANRWLEISEFADIVAVSQMTPGPVAVNAATFIGVRTAGIPGALAATIGLIVPSLIIIIIVAHMIDRFKESTLIQGMLLGIRPAAIGLIGTAVMIFASMSIYSGSLSSGDVRVHWQGIVIFLSVLVLATYVKVHPIFSVIFSTVAGIILFNLPG
jgi:chromate transporter